MSSEESQKELALLLQTLIDIFSKELRDSYLTTVVEQVPNVNVDVFKATVNMEYIFTGN